MPIRKHWVDWRQMLADKKELCINPYVTVYGFM